MGSGTSDGADSTGMDMWHSWNLGPVHFLSYDTEVFFAASPATRQRMVTWLTEDLAAANAPAARKLQPWVIAYGHRPMMCSDTDGDDCTKDNSTVRAALETVFHTGGVDMVFAAHEHSYERMWPTYDPPSSTPGQN